MIVFDVTRHPHGGSVGLTADVRGAQPQLGQDRAELAVPHGCYVFPGHAQGTCHAAHHCRGKGCTFDIIVPFFLWFLSFGEESQCRCLGCQLECFVKGWCGLFHSFTGLFMNWWDVSFLTLFFNLMSWNLKKRVNSGELRNPVSVLWLTVKLFCIVTLGQQWHSAFLCWWLPGVSASVAVRR